MAMMLNAQASNEILQAIWQWNANDDPTTINFDNDTNTDWIIRSGAPFNTTGLYTTGEGRTVWQSPVGTAQLIDSRPKNALNGSRLEVDVWWEALGPGAWDAIFWINLDFYPDFYPDNIGAPGNATYAAIFARLTRVGTNQHLQINNNVGGGVIGAVSNLRTGMLHMHWDVDMSNDTISVSIDGVPKTTIPYVPASSFNNFDAFATLLTSSGRFDRVIIQHFAEGVPPGPLPLAHPGGSIFMLQ